MFGTSLTIKFAEILKLIVAAICCGIVKKQEGAAIQDDASLVIDERIPYLEDDTNWNIDTCLC